MNPMNQTNLVRRSAVTLLLAVAAISGETSEELRTRIRERGDAKDLATATRIGTRFYQGFIGGGPDYPAAAEWYKLAAEHGHAEAQVYLGFMYMKGQGVPEDQSEAVKWSRLVAEQGDPRGQHNLGAAYADGQGVPQDYAEARKWFRLAAEQGEATAQLNLGVMYHEGQGVPQDYVEAHKWYNLAASRTTGELREKAAKNRDLIARDMTPAQVAEAQRVAREWRCQGWSKIRPPWRSKTRPMGARVKGSESRRDQDEPVVNHRCDAG